MRLLKCQHILAYQEGNKPDFRWFTLSKFFAYQRKIFLSNAGMCFGDVVVAIDAFLRSLKGKILLRINKSWVQNLPRYESKM